MRDAQTETVLPQSMRTLEEYASDVLAECEARDVTVDDLRAELDAHGLSDDHSEILDALERLSDAGYACEEANDHLYIYEHGSYWFTGDDLVESRAIINGSLATT